MLALLRDIKFRFITMWPIVIGILGCLYFGYHAFSGNRGIIRLIEVNRQLTLSAAMATSIAKEKAAWQAEVKALSPSSLDIDKLQEVALEVLNLGTEQDFIITDAKLDWQK